jgi:hypothetical protein
LRWPTVRAKCAQGRRWGQGCARVQVRVAWVTDCGSSASLQPQPVTGAPRFGLAADETAVLYSSLPPKCCYRALHNDARHLGTTRSGRRTASALTCASFGDCRPSDIGEQAPTGERPKSALCAAPCSLSVSQKGHATSLSARTSKAHARCFRVEGAPTRRAVIEGLAIAERPCQTAGVNFQSSHTKVPAPRLLQHAANPHRPEIWDGLACT